MKRRLLPMLSVFICLIVLTGAVALLYATFFAAQEFDTEISTGLFEVAMRPTGEGIVVDADGTMTADATLITAGDRFEIPFTLTNRGDAAAYGAPRLTLDADSGLSHVLLVTLDGAFVGVLGDLVGADGTAVLPAQWLLTKAGTAAAAQTHTLTLEYHVGAGDFYRDKTCRVKLDCVAKQALNTDGIAFVSDDYAFRQAVKTINAGKLTKIVLADDVTLTQSAVLTVPAAVELSGCTLTVPLGAELKFAYAAAAPSALTDAVGTGTVAGTVTFDTPAAYVSGNIPLAPETVSYGAETLARDYGEYLDNALRGTLQQSQSVDLIGAFRYYRGSISLESTDYSIVRVENDKLIVTLAATETRSAFLRAQVAGAQKRMVAVTAAGRTTEAMLDEIADEFFFANAAAPVAFFATGADGAAVGAATEQTAYLLASHILLPSAVRAHGARIRWISEDENVLGADGRFAAPAQTNVRVGTADGMLAYRFRLTAAVSVNGETYLRDYVVYAATVTPTEKLARLVMRYSPLVFGEVGQSQPLPKLADYAGMGFSALSFEFDETLFEKREDTLVLIRDTTQTEATVTVRATVYGEAVEDALDVLILLKHSDSIFEKVREYLDELLAALPVNVVGDFELPASYDKTVSMIYTFVDSVTHAPLDPQPEYIALSRRADADSWTFSLDRYKLPNRNVVLTLEAKMVFDNGVTRQEDARYFDLGVGGVYHNTAEDVPDVSLHYALMRAYNTDGDDFLTVDEVAAGIARDPTLSLQGKNIVDLKGIEFLEGLTELDLASNRIVSLDAVGGLGSLRKLLVGGNRIRVISALSETALTYLDLSNNLVTDISPLAELPLQYLDVSSNSISGFAAIEGMSALKTLKTTANPGAFSETNDFYFIRLYGTTGAAIERTGSRYVPTAAQIAAMKTLSALSPVYEMEDVLYLPASVGGSAITWSTNSEYAEIVRFDDGTGRVFVTQPLADVSVSIGAKITVSGVTLTRFFVILSHEGVYRQTIGGKDARVAVPDAALRYELFRLYGNPITLDPAAVPSISALDLSGKGVADLTGLELFAGKIVSVDLTSNSLRADAWGHLAAMTGLKTLRIGGVALDLAAFSTLAGLEELRLFGCTGTEDAEQHAYLRTLFDNGAAIYPDGATLWNPYREDLAKALSRLDRYFVLTWNGGEYRLPTTLTVPSTGDTVALSYAATSNSLYTLSGSNLSMSVGNIPAADVNYGLQVSASYRGADVTAYWTVVMPTEKRMTVRAQVASGTYGYYNLFETMPDETARRTVLRQFTGKTDAAGAPYIDFTELNKIADITFNGAGDHGVKGLELFNLTNLASVKAFGYSSRYADGDPSGFSAYTTAGNQGGTLAAPRLAKLTTVAFENSSVELADLAKLTALTALDMIRCLYVGMYRDSVSVFATLVNLTTVKMIDCDVTDTSAFRALRKADTIWLYNNPISDYYAEFNEDMTVAYGNLSTNVTGSAYDYRIAGKDIRWTVGSVSNISFTSGGGSVNLEEGLGSLNYVDSVMQVELPDAVSVSGQNVLLSATSDGAPIGVWNSSAPELLALSGEGVATSFVIDPAKVTGAPYGYVLLTLRIVNNNAASGYPIISATLYFAFLVRNPAVTDGGDNVNFADFLDTEGRAKDEIFLNYAAGTLAATEPTANGVFSKAAASRIPFFVDVASPTAATGENVYRGYSALNQLQGVTDLSGIRNFTGIYFLNLNNNSVDDLSELRYLVGMEALYLENSPVTTLETHFTDAEIAAADVWAKKPADGVMLTINQEYADTPRQGIFDYMSKLHILDLQYASAIVDYAPIAWRVGVSDASVSASDAAGLAAATESARLNATKKLANIGSFTTLVNTNVYLEYGQNHYFEAFAAHFAARNEINDAGLLNKSTETDYYITHSRYPGGDMIYNYAKTTYSFLNTVNSYVTVSYGSNKADLERIFQANDILASYERQLKLAAAEQTAVLGKPVAPLTVRMNRKTVSGVTQTAYSFEDLTDPAVTTRFAKTVRYLDADGGAVLDTDGKEITANVVWQEHIGRQAAVKTDQKDNQTTYFDFTKANTDVWSMKNDTLFYSGEQTFRMNCYIAVPVMVYSNLRYAVVSRIFDVRMVKDAVEGGATVSGQTVGSRIELTAKEAAVYAARGVTVTTEAGEAYAGETTGLFYASSVELIPDSTFRNLIYAQLKLTQPVVTLDLRSGYKNGAFQNGVAMNFSTVGIYDVTGYELFTCVSNWSFTYALIRRVPEVPVPARRVASDGSTAANPLYRFSCFGCRYLADLSGLAFDADGDGADYMPLKDLPMLKDLFFTSAVGVGNAQLRYLFPLLPKNGIQWNIRIDGTSITDLSFLTTPEFRRLTFAENGLGLFTNAAFINYGSNLDDVKYMYLTNTKHNLFGTGFAPSVIWEDRISIFYGELNAAFSAGATSPLTPSFTMYGTEFGVTYAAATDGDYDAVEVADGTEFYYRNRLDDGSYVRGARFAKLFMQDGAPYLTLDADVPQTFVLRATAIYHNPETGTDDPTFAEKLTVMTGEGGSGGNVAEEYPTEGAIETADGTFAALSDVVPSPELRYHFLRDVDADGDGRITLAEQAAVTELKLFSATSFEAKVVCRDLGGIERLRNLQSLQIGVCRLEDLSPIASLTALRMLGIFNQTRITDFSFLEPLTALRSFSLSGDFSDLNFLFSSTGLTSVGGISTGGNTPYAAYVRNAVAYARAFGALRDDDLSIGNTEANQSTSDEKISADLLSRIAVPERYRMGKTAAQANRLDFGLGGVIADLPTTLRFRTSAHDGECDYNVTWQSLSPYLSFGASGLTVTAADGKTVAGMIATVEYNGARYDRYYYTLI